MIRHQSSERADRDESTWPAEQNGAVLEKETIELSTVTPQPFNHIEHEAATKESLLRAEEAGFPMTPLFRNEHYVQFSFAHFVHDASNKYRWMILS